LSTAIPRIVYLDRR